jgi:hypothetical protein
MLRKILPLLFTLFSLKAFAQAPVINSFSPASAAVGASVAITGSGFDVAVGNNIVFFGGVKAVINTANTGSISAVVPAGSQNLPITVINLSTGLQGSSTRPFYTTFVENDSKTFAAGSFSQSTFHDYNGGFFSWFTLSDVDNDGKIDLVLVNSFNQTINIYRNTATSGGLSSASLTLAATFNVTPTYLAYGPRAVKLADLDGDGKQDIVVPYLEQRKVGIYKNNTTPGNVSRALFSSEIQISVGSTPTSVAIADLNADGKPEIITANSSGGSVTILKNIATRGNLNTASFAAAQDISLSNLGSSPSSVEAGDLDADGKPDLLVGMYGGFAVLRNTTTTALGVLSFTGAQTYAGSGVVRAYLSDLDGDNKYDIVAHTYEQRGIYIFRNTTTSAGNITLGAQVSLPTYSPIESLQFGDLNGDTHPEIITTPYSGDCVAFINANTSGSITAAAFGAEITMGVGSPDWGTVAVGDIDGDGKPDIISEDGYSTVTLLHNNIVGKPQVISFNPTSAGPGQAVTITGKYFTGAYNVTFGGKPATKVTVNSPTSISAVLDRGNTGYVAVTNYEGRDSIPGFTYSGPPPPVVTGFSPTSGGEGTILSVSGANFSSGMVVKIGGVYPRSIYSITGNSMTVVVDTGATGPITVSNIDGTGASSLPFTFTPLPQIYSIDKATAAKGETITIKGKYLANTSSITLGGVPVASFVQVSSTKVTFVVGDGDTGELVLTTPFGSGTSYFTYSLPPPSVSSVAPLAAPAGATVTIKGANFSVLPEKNFVFFGTIKAKVIAASPTSLSVTVPTGAVYAPVYVTVHNYTAFSDQRFSLTFSGGGKIDTTTFGAATYMFLGYNVNTFQIADANGDGNADIMIPNQGYTELGVRYNQSKKGAFKLPYTDFRLYNSDSGGGPIDGVAADFDNDGDLDFAMHGAYGASFYLSNINGTYHADTYPGRGDYGVTGLVAGDMNGDGITERIPFRAAGRGYIADLDGDHKLDYIQAGDKLLSIQRNITPAGSSSQAEYAPAVQLPLSGASERLTIGDFDGDGKADIVAINGGSNDSTTNFVVFRNTSTVGNIIFSQVLSLPPLAKELYRTAACTSGDLDGDGLIDLVYSGKGKTVVFKNTSKPGTISFAPKVEFAVNGSVWLGIADFDGDGQPDIAGLGEYSGGSVLNILRNLTGTIPVTNIQPAYGTVGTTITITGKGLSGATGVTLGGYTLKNYKIVSDNTITAVVDTTVSGYATITTAGNSGTSLTRYYTADKPEIAPADTVYLLQGDSVLLATTKKTGYYTDASYYSPYDAGHYESGYQWVKDGKEILFATWFTYNVKEAGVYSVNIKLLPSGTIASNKVVVIVTPKLPPNTFLVSATNATCKGTLNGAITITAKSVINCTALITAPGYNYSAKLTTRLAVAGLSAGTYNVCIKPDARPDLQQCYTVVISEPKDITLYDVVSRDKKTVTLAMSGGSIYNIQLNGVLRTTTDSVITLPLTAGANRLVITSDRLCQGVIDKIINANPAVFPYPNPIGRMLYVSLGRQQVATARVEIYSVMGALVYTADFKQPGSTLQMDLSSLTMTGTYVLKLTTDDQPQQIFNIIKR